MQPQQQPQQFQFAYSPEFQQFRLQPSQQQVNNDIPSFQQTSSQFQQPSQQQASNGQTFLQPPLRQETSTAFYNNNNFQQQKLNNVQGNQQFVPQQSFPQGTHFQQQQHLLMQTSVPIEFQEQLPELIKPPIMMGGASSEQKHLHRDQQQSFQQQLIPPPLAPPQWALQQSQRSQQFQQQQRPHFVHIQPVQIPQKEFIKMLPNELQGGSQQFVGIKQEQQQRIYSPKTTRTTQLITTTRKTTATLITKQINNLNQQKRPMKVGETNKKEIIQTNIEFDLPPPPPSRFLPESEKIRISELIRQNKLLKNIAIQEEGKELITSITSFPTLVSTKKLLLSTSTIPTKMPKKLSTQSFSHRKDPNRVFLDCCKRKRVAKSCESRCNFDVLNKKILTSMFLGSDKCPTEFGLDLFTCAAQDSDHSSCCKSKNVHSTAAGDKCLAFCNLSPDAPKIQLDASYLPCWAVLQEVKSCFREGINRTP
uniref:DB domain-containing protein n=1 Tax=Meloidogyne hapla TaxID=6305 RepID=A0A1I8BNU9_MELHA